MASSDGLVELQPGLSFWGRVTSVISATQFTCNMLRGKGDALFQLWLVTVVRKGDGSGGAPQHDGALITAYVSTTGLFTHTAFSTGNLSVGDEIYVIYPEIISSALHGLIVYSGYGTPNWNSGFATSGLPGADVTTIGVVGAGNDYLVHSLLISIANLTVGATITVRLYTNIATFERMCYSQNFVQGTDPDGLWIINGTLGLSSPLRIELYSNNALDDGLQVEYEYMRQP